jgi:hypothetical protein
MYNNSPTMIDFFKLKKVSEILNLKDFQKCIIQLVNQTLWNKTVTGRVTVST